MYNLSTVERAEVIKSATLYVLANHARLPGDRENFVSEVALVAKNLYKKLEDQLS